MNLFRTSCATLFGYDWVGVPLVYTQACLTSLTYLDVCVARLIKSELISHHYCNQITALSSHTEGRRLPQ